MKMLRIPLRLFLLANTLWLSVLFACVAVMIYMRSPYWDLPIDLLKQMALGVSVFVLPMYLSVLRAKRWVLKAFPVFAFFLCFTTAAFSLWGKSFWLGVFDLFLIFYCVTLHQLLKAELNRSYLNPLKQWFQGYPRPIPGLECEWIDLDSDDPDSSPKQVFTVSRMDGEGSFVFLRSLADKPLLRELRRPKDFRFRYKEFDVSCRARAIRKMKEPFGVGIRFEQMNLDERKHLSDFVEVLRGAGHVQ